MQSAAVPCTSNSNGIKRSAASALLSDSTSQQPSHSSDSTSRMNQSSDSPPPPEKRSFIVVESPLKLETIASAEDLDIKVLRIQNKNLSERLVQRQKLEADLRDKIEQLQTRRTTDDSKLCIIDRYWTQLDDDLRVIMERFDCSLSSTDSDNQSTANQTLRNFLAKLKDWDKFELEENIKERVKFTTQTVSKLVVNYDRLVKKNEQYFKELAQSKATEGNMKDLVQENGRLNDLTLKLQQKIHSTGLEKKELEDRIACLENDIKELNKKNDETEYELEKLSDKAFKLDRQLAESLVKYQKLKASVNVNETSNNSNNNNNGINNSNNNHMDVNGHSSSSNCFNNKNFEKQISELEAMLEEQRELASSRLTELDKLNQEYQSSLKQIEKLKMDLKTVPSNVIEQSTEFRHLQTKYSLTVNDNLKLKHALDETRHLLETSRGAFQRQLEQMESEELANQKKLGNEMMLIEEQLAQVRKENELLRIEYEQNMAANEQTGPINKEMRSLITTLQTNNKLLKTEIARTKKWLDEAHQEIERYKKLNAQQQSQINHFSSKKSSESSSSQKSNNTDELDDKKEDDGSNDSLNKKVHQSPLKTNDMDASKIEIKRLKEALEKEKNKKATNSSIASPSIQPNHQDGQNSSNQTATNASEANSSHYKKIRQLEDQVRDLHKSLSNKKQEESALLNDMEITGQAFEDMQEQNIRLMQQLREKDDANFKLVSERIKLENVQKILKEEKEMYLQQVIALQEQQEAQMSISKKLEEQIQILSQNKTILEKELFQFQQINETCRRQSFDNIQLIQDLKLNTQKYSVQLKEAQSQIAEKTELLASQSYKNNRSQEEIKHLQQKLERQKRFENGASIDEVLREENREYKEQLRCPSCKVKQKDAVLTKCFHVFCHDCLQKRYETRQRKCPKCNANFGANDFHKLYLS